MMSTKFYLRQNLKVILTFRLVHLSRRCDFSVVLKEFNDGDCLISSGNKFHCLAPTMENERSL